MKEEKDKIVEFLKKNKIDLFFVGLAVLTGVYLGWKNMEVLIFTIFIGIILRPISSRYLAIPALFFLALTVVALMMDNKAQADEFAIFVYYFLIMAVIMGVREVRVEEKKAE